MARATWEDKVADYLTAQVEMKRRAECYPVLLEALEALVAESYGEDSEGLRAARAAIKLAKEA